MQSRYSHEIGKLSLWFSSENRSVRKLFIYDSELLCTAVRGSVVTDNDLLVLSLPVRYFGFCDTGSPGGFDGKSTRRELGHERNLRPGRTSQRTSLPLWMIALIVFGVLAVLGVTIGLLVHFLAVEKKTYYYQGNFKIKGDSFNSNYGKETSEENTALSKMIENRMLDAFQKSNIHNQYANSQVIKLIPSSDGVMVDIWLMFKSSRGKKTDLKRNIESILRRMLQNNSDSLTSDPSSLTITETSKVDAEKTINNCCGRRAKVSSAYDRIKGGSAAQEGEWPWQASLKLKNRHYCGASLISNRWLVTAAHCFREHKNISEWTVSFGTVVNPPYMKNKIKAFIIHENYNPRAHHDDIAVVLLDKAVSFTNNVHRVCLPEPTQNFPPGSDVVVTGWGALSKNGPYPPSLQKAPVKIIDTSICNSRDSYDGAILDTMLCAGYMEGHIDACQGDSGGPLVYPNSRNIWFLVGIVSWGDDCGKKNKPGVYVRMTSYRQWVASKTGV
ncbi:transmembrane protease serine 11B-like protein [Monodelphis domestica]|uniref:transmembrane protease serine 11B-like protein n=1 Tax=Monodelphis domestica TaxID=13616 RepID=UPI0024E251BC|nr:transmembrane protease serine 11B-like protein [Monodelphis domestica]